MEGQFSARYQKFGFGILVALVLVASAYVLLPFLPAIMWAVVLTVLMLPIHKKFRARMNETLAAAVTTLTTILIIVIPLAVVSSILVSEVSGYVKNIAHSAPAGQSPYSPEYLLGELDKALQPVAERLGNKDFSTLEWFNENKTQLGKSGGPLVAKGAANFGVGVFTLVIAFLTMFFFLRDGHKLKDPAMELIPLPKERAMSVIEKMGKTIHAVFVGVVMVALIQGTLAGIAYWAAGVPSPLVWGIVTVVLCAIPLLGAPVAYVPLGIILMAQGNWAGGIGLIAFGFIVISQVDNFLRPFIIGSRVALHPMAIFFSLLGGVFALGPVGLMAGPVLLTVALALQDVIRERIAIEQGTREAGPSEGMIADL